ncbi:FecR family protein [Pedobacter nyackensis]|uniref:FecR family protein n=1 Tax=Pedobacter nyackensis TaxID=475255 RepID=UPI0029313D56|nr:FecR domain-containing protein [Pedobacter nyackensis]
MEQQKLSKLFSAYVDNRLSVEEKKELMNFISQSHARDALSGPMEQLWEECRLKAVLDADSELRIQKVMQQIKPQRDWIRYLIPYAVAACLTIVIGFLYFFSSLNHSQQTPLKSHTLSAQYGERKTISLSDGTVVTLSGGSSLSYKSDYNINNRTISFQGEGFFEVAKNPAKPFIVEYTGLYTKVLGTSFNIRAFDKDRNIDVTVATGLVEVGEIKNGSHEKKALANLKAGQQLSYTKVSGLLKVDTLSNLAQVTAWKKDILILKGERFEEIALMLERWYNVKISFEQEQLKNCRFKGTFKSLSITALLDLLKKSAGFSYSIHDNHIIIKGRGCL